MKKKYTSGPWIFEGGDNGSCEISIGDTTAYFPRHERNTGIYVIEREEMEANTRLAAAAPDLLEALTQCLDRIKFLQQYTGEKVDRSQCIVLAESAIKKATE